LRTHDAFDMTGGRLWWDELLLSTLTHWTQPSRPSVAMLYCIVSCSWIHSTYQHSV